MYRIGFGYDVHPLAEGRPFRLGGVLIPHSKGPVGHSDADALVHALVDALLGAAGVGDIGLHFPDTDPQYRNMDSSLLLKKTVSMLRKKGYAVVNVDSTVCLQHPKIQAHIPSMKKKLAPILGIEENALSIKATTSEKMGFVGREEGVAVYAVALIER